MKRNLILIALVAMLGVILFAHPWENIAADRGHPWGEIWERHEAGEIQFAILVTEDQMATKDIPIEWTREMIVSWLEKRLLVIEEIPIGDIQTEKCHLVVRDYHRLCVNGGGTRRCNCEMDVQH